MAKQAKASILRISSNQRFISTRRRVVCSRALKNCSVEKESFWAFLSLSRCNNSGKPTAKSANKKNGFRKLIYVKIPYVSVSD